MLKPHDAIIRDQDDYVVYEKSPSDWWHKGPVASCMELTERRELRSDPKQLSRRRMTFIPGFRAATCAAWIFRARRFYIESLLQA